MKTFLVAALAFLFIACSHRAPAPAAESKPVGVDTAAIDTSISPCTDFYQYACGRWDATHSIPNDQTTWGSFNELAEKNREVLHKILDDAATNTASKDHITQEVGDYYAACMNQGVIDSAGIKPIQSELDNVNSVSSKDELGAEVARLQVNGVDALFNFGSDQDFKNATAEIAEADQGGLGLPDRDYYLKTDPKSVTLRQQYVAHVQKMFGLIGEKPADAARDARTVMSIETALARASMDNVARRDPSAVYHKMSVAQFQALAPTLNWKAFFTAAGGPSFDTMNVAVPGFFRALNAELQSVPLNDWKAYLRWHLVHAAAPALSQPFVDANFEFFGTQLTGQKQISPRWRRCVNSTDGHLGEALGQIYVKDNFTPQAKATMETMVRNLESSLGRDIQSLDWMTPATKQAAAVKLAAIANQIGYPDKWRDYSSIVITRDNYYTDLRRANAFEWHRQLNKIGKPIDRTEWQMTPPTVNAYYTPLFNEIFFPAGILQPPFYNQHRDLATNYGGAGVVIGHELTHGFDDQGRQFDAQGNLRDWWTPADAKAFQQRAACIINEYSDFSPISGVKLNGKLTLGENTADNGGARVAYMAMESALSGTPDDLIDGYNRAQRFFLGFAQVFCENIRPEMSRLLATVDPHSPGRFRVDGVVTNMPEFAAAFKCGPTTPMAPKPQSCRVW
ncbi:MAG TPA: M13 family metallopeptidase [Terriglobales bacterium]|nr:M13 family metallopeptidase [Terriglobales bacterium]